jgi:hypothetical protein
MYPKGMVLWGLTGADPPPGPDDDDAEAKEEEEGPAWLGSRNLSLREGRKRGDGERDEMVRTGGRR